MLKVVKQEACSSGFAAIYITSERRLENIVKAMSESAYQTLAERGGSAWAGGGGQELFGLLSPWDPLHTRTTCGVTGAGEYFQLHFHLPLLCTHGHTGLGHPTGGWGWGIAFLSGIMGLLPHVLLPLPSPDAAVSLGAARSGSTGLFFKKP